MNAIIILALLCIFYEFIKLSFMNKYWTFGITQHKKSPLFIFDMGYAVFTTYLLFTPYYWIGIAIWIISITTAAGLYNKALLHQELDQRSRAIFLLDSILSIVLLLVLILLCYYKI